MTIALTGATGLIGAEVHRRLANRADVRVIGRAEADLDRPEQVQRLDLSGCDTLVHCAGVTDGDFSDDVTRAYVHATAGTAALVERAVKAGVRKLVCVSTAHVYAPLAGRIDETQAPNPVGDYGIAHYAAEQIFRRKQSASTNVLIVRPCAVFGVPRYLERFDRWSLIPYSFPLEAVTAQKIVLRSTGEQRRNFVATGDIAAAIDAWLGAPEARTLNAVGPDTLSVYEFGLQCAAAYERVTGGRCSVERPGGGERQELDYTTLYEKLPTGVGQYLEEMIRTLITEAKAGRIHGS